MTKTEYKIAYYGLVTAVAKFDYEAAKYLVSKATKLATFSYSADLSGAFVWKDTPQGSTYWSDLCHKVYD